MRIVLSGLLLCLSIVCFVLSVRQKKEIGPLMSNAYFYASEQEREKMNKKPYFTQASVIFLLLGIVFLIIAIDMLLMTKWLVFCSVGTAVAAIIYALVSSARINKEEKK